MVLLFIDKNVIEVNGNRIKIICDSNLNSRVYFIRIENKTVNVDIIQEILRLEVNVHKLENSHLLESNRAENHQT